MFVCYTCLYVDACVVLDDLVQSGELYMVNPEEIHWRFGLEEESEFKASITWPIHLNQLNSYACVYPWYP